MQKDICDMDYKMMIIGGDFNAHIMERGGKQDRNGDLMKELVENNSLEIGNLLEQCEGQITWQRKNQKSSIDFVLMNEEATMRTTKIKIDEEGLWSLGSDHNRILVILEEISKSKKRN